MIPRIAFMTIVLSLRYAIFINSAFIRPGTYKTCIPIRAAWPVFEFITLSDRPAPALARSCRIWGSRSGTGVGVLARVPARLDRDNRQPG